MNPNEIIQQRLHNQQLVKSKSNKNKPEEIVKQLGAIQSQDYYGAKWAIGLRAKSLKDADIEEAFNKGHILRTHILRPTWHFIHPSDIRWMLQLTAPRIKAASKYYLRTLSLDDIIIKKSLRAIESTFQDRKHHTRTEIIGSLKKVNIHTNNLGYIYLIGNAELDGLICSGARRDKQQTYALLDQRAPEKNPYNENEALEELTKRYFISHGPATIQDFAWWSGLRTYDAKKGIEMNKASLSREVVNKIEYWFSSTMLSIKNISEDIQLLPNYDEYIIGYANRNLIFNSSHISKLDARANPLFQNTIVSNGEIIGTWKRTIKKDRIIVSPTLFKGQSTEELTKLERASTRYTTFLNKTEINKEEDQ